MAIRMTGYSNLDAAQTRANLLNGWTYKVQNKIGANWVDMNSTTEYDTVNELRYVISVDESMWVVGAGTQTGSSFVNVLDISILTDDGEFSLYDTSLQSFAYNHSLPSSSGEVPNHCYFRSNYGKTVMPAFRVVNSNGTQFVGIYHPRWGTGHEDDYSPNKVWGSATRSDLIYQARRYIQQTEMPDNGLGGLNYNRMYKPRLKVTYMRNSWQSNQFATSTNIKYFDFTPTGGFKMISYAPFLKLEMSKENVYLAEEYSVKVSWRGLIHGGSNYITLSFKNVDEIVERVIEPVVNATDTKAVEGFSSFTFNRVGPVTVTATAESTSGTISYVTGFNYINPFSISVKADGPRGITNSCAGKIDDVFTLSATTGPGSNKRYIEDGKGYAQWYTTTPTYTTIEEDYTRIKVHIDGSTITYRDNIIIRPITGVSFTELDRVTFKISTNSTRDIEIRFRVNESNYYKYTYNNGKLLNNTSILTFTPLKFNFTAVGSPSWASITDVVLIINTINPFNAALRMDVLEITYPNPSGAVQYNNARYILSTPAYFNDETEAKITHPIDFDQSTTVRMTQTGYHDLSAYGEYDTAGYNLDTNIVKDYVTSAIYVIQNNALYSGYLKSGGSATDRIRNVRVLYNFKKTVGELDLSSDLIDKPGNTKGIHFLKLHGENKTDLNKNILTGRDLYVGTFSEPHLIEVIGLGYMQPNRTYAKKPQNMPSVKSYVGYSDTASVYTPPSPNSTSWSEFNSELKSVLSTPDDSGITINADDTQEPIVGKAHSIACLCFELDNPIGINMAAYIEEAYINFSCKVNTASVDVPTKTLYVWDYTSQAWISINFAEIGICDFENEHALSYIDVAKILKTRGRQSGTGRSIFCITAIANKTAPEVPRAKLDIDYIGMYASYDENVTEVDPKRSRSRTMPIPAGCKYEILKLQRGMTGSPFYETYKFSFQLPKEVRSINGIYQYDPGQDYTDKGLKNPNILERIDMNVLGFGGFAWLPEYEIINGTVNMTIKVTTTFGRDLIQENMKALRNILHIMRRDTHVDEFFVDYPEPRIISYKNTANPMLTGNDIILKLTSLGEYDLYLKNSSRCPIVGYSSGAATSPRLFLNYSYVEGEPMVYSKVNKDSYQCKRIGQGIDMPPGIPLVVSFQVDNLNDEKINEAPIVPSDITGVGCAGMPMRRYKDEHFLALDESDPDIEKRFHLDKTKIV